MSGLFNRLSRTPFMIGLRDLWKGSPADRREEVGRALLATARRFRKECQKGTASESKLREAIGVYLGPVWEHVMRGSNAPPRQAAIDRVKTLPVRSLTEYPLERVFGWLGSWYNFGDAMTCPPPPGKPKDSAGASVVKTQRYEFLVLAVDLDATYVRYEGDNWLYLGKTSDIVRLWEANEEELRRR